MKGFAFVWMLSRKDAERALEKTNGMKLHPGMVEDVQKKKKLRREEEKGKKLEREERTIAVDWALSKDRWEEEKAKMDVDGEEEAGAVEPADSEDDSDEDGSEAGSSEDEDELGVHSGDSSDSAPDGEENDEDAHSDAPTKPQLPPPETGNTLFVRNVPFQATEDELRTL
jgi:nucleolar protein 4